MIETPECLTETPGCSDPLSDLLDKMHLSGMVLLRTEFREPWSLLTPDSCQMARMLPFRAEHILSFHLVAQGGCRLELDGQASVWLAEGDAVLLPHGDAHGLGGEEPAARIPVANLLPPPPLRDIQTLRHGGEGALTRLICGFMQCSALLFPALLHHLPRLIHVRPSTDPEDAWLASTLRYTAHEASQDRPGSRSMLPRLTELMFVEILRKHMRALSADEVGWLAALNDPVTGNALKLLHSAPLEAWDVDGLARRAGTSRSVLAERFRHYLGQPPMQYLTHWRLQLAAQALMNSNLPLKRVAEQAGYESEAAFSRAFKRRFATSPAAWRKGRQPAAGPV